MCDLATLNAYLREEGIKHFAAEEISPVGKLANGVGPASLLAPTHFWPRIIPTLRVVEDLREATNGPIIVLSGYRDPDYNAAVGGAPKSQHLEFTALDIRSPRWPPQAVYNWLGRHPFRHKLGLGLYPTFVHVDTRGLRGHDAPARW